MCYQLHFLKEQKKQTNETIYTIVHTYHKLNTLYNVPSTMQIAFKKREGISKNILNSLEIYTMHRIFFKFCRSDHSLFK